MIYKLDAGFDAVWAGGGSWRGSGGERKAIAGWLEAKAAEPPRTTTPALCCSARRDRSPTDAPSHRDRPRLVPPRDHQELPLVPVYASPLPLARAAERLSLPCRPRTEAVSRARARASSRVTRPPPPRRSPSLGGPRRRGVCEREREREQRAKAQTATPVVERGSFSLSLSCARALWRCSLARRTKRARG